jgi:hypothetical protein
MSGLQDPNPKILRGKELDRKAARNRHVSNY